MENNEQNIKTENNGNENELNQFSNLTLYTDRIVELINKNIIDYTSKY